MSAETLQTIGNRLLGARRQKGLTQAEVAKKAGMGTNRYAVIERGEAKNMTINKLEEIVKALDVKSSDILPF
jgi:transcriptional regulator with XRE-family HTH domain